MANGELFDMIVFIQGNLPPGDNVTGYTILTEGFNDPTWYSIEFMIDVEYDINLPGLPK